MRFERGMRGGWGLAAAAALLALAAAGCALSTETMGSGKEARVWRGGKLTKTYEADYEKVWKACGAVVRDSRLEVESERHDALVGLIKARRADRVVVRVEIERNDAAGRQVQVSVGVGLLGTDREKQQASELMDALDKKLGRK
jgi:hypothetical protein